MKKILRVSFFAFLTTAIYAQIPITNLSLWLKADAGLTTTTGNLINSNWTDQSPNALVMTKSGSPTIITVLSLNGQRFVHFPGGSDFTNSSAIFNFTKFTFFAVARVTSGDIFYNNNYGFGYESGSNGRFYINTTGSRAQYPNYLNNVAIFSGMYNLSSITGAVNTTVVSPFTYSSPINSSSTFYVANGYGLLNGDIAEIIIYNTDLTLSQKDQVYNYLAAKYNIGINPNAPTISSFATTYSLLDVAFVGTRVAASGYASDGDYVSVSGTNFTSVTGVFINNIPVATYTVTSPISLSFTLPDGLLYPDNDLTGKIKIVNNYGPGISAQDLQVIYTSVTPSSNFNVVQNGSFQIVGSDLSQINLISIGGINVPFSYNSNTKRITVSVTTAVGLGAQSIILSQNTYLGNQLYSLDPIQAIVVTSLTSPIIISVTPSKGVVGSSVILAGSGFAGTPSDNTVYFGGVQANVTAASATSVTVSAPAGLSYQNISLLNINSKSQAQANASYVNTFLGGCIFTANTFGPEVLSNINSYGYFSTVADLNGDGKPEIITSHKYYTTGIYIVQNQTSNNTITSSSFSTPVYLSNTSNRSYQVIARDFDNDGKLDLAVYNTNGTVQIFQNIHISGAITSGSFANPVSIAIPVGGFAMDAADIDADGKIDIAVAAYGTNNTLYILKNQFTGNTIAGSSFASPVAINFGTGAYPVDLKLIDIDNDGKVDLATANQSNSANSYVSIFRNITPQGVINASTFNTPVSISLPNTFNQGTADPERLNSIEWADFDNDGKLDLAATNRSINSISIFKNKSTAGTINAASFNEKYDFSTGTIPQGLAVGDLNGDGKIDIAVASEGENKVYLFRNQAVSGTITGTSFAARFDFGTTYANSTQPQITDLDNDGKPELILSNWNYATNSIFKNLITDPPTITGFSPSSGLANSTLVTITGAGFVNITTVGFGTGTTSFFTVVNPNTIIAKLPLTATTGLVSVANLTGGLAYSTSNITVTSAAVPSITGFSPVNGSVGSSVVISGSGFDAIASNNAVFIGRIQASITGANATSLTIIVPSDATYDLIRVTNLSSSLAAESKIPFNVTFIGPNTITSASFAPKADVTADYYIYQALFADIDGDGNSDMLSANYSSNTFSVYRNTGTGTNLQNQFAPRVNFSTGVNAYKLAIADFDGDGKLDVVVSNYSSNTISVFRNISSLGSIAFAPKVDFSTGANPSGIEVADFDKDGSIDIAVANYNTNFISIFKNNNITGTITGLSFLSRQDYTSQYYSYNVAITDIDGDGYPDIATSTQNTNTISVFKNQSSNSNISFALKVDITSQYYPWDIKFADFDADGKPDMIVSNSSYGTISILRNQATVGTITSASFASKIDFNTNSTPYGLTLGDVDGDGKVDIATSYGSSGFVSVLRNTSTASGINASTLAPKLDFLGAGTSSYYPSLGDIDGDGKLELAIPNSQYSTISLFRNLSGPGPTLTGFALTSGQAGVDLFSITGNALSNISTVWVGSGYTVSQFTIVGSNLIIAKVPAGATTGSVSVLNSFGATATAPGIYTISLPYPYPSITGISPTKGFVGTLVQINGFNLATSPGGNLLYFGAVRVPIQTATTTQLVAIVPGGTSFADIKLLNTVTGLATSYNLPFVNTFAGANTLTAAAFGNKTDLNVSSTPYASTLADLDGDGKPELISSEYSSNAISVFRNISSVGTIGGGSFAARQSFSTASNPYEIVAADIDSDGKLDLLTANYAGSSISIFRNISSGPGNIAFTTRFDLALPGNAYNLAVGDLDLDGYLDIVSSNRSVNSISIFRNRGLTGTVAGASFDTRLDITTGSGPYDVELADINGDSKPEILIVYSSFLGVYHNKTSIGNINSASFSNAVNFSGLNTAFCVKAADMDGDNRLDVIIGDYGNNRLAWFRNLGLTSTISGSSLSTLQFLTGSGNPAGLALADFDGDGKVDVASGNYGSGNVVSLWRNISTVGGVAFASYANL